MKIVAIAVNGPCGICCISCPDSIDCGATFYCIQCNQPIVFDVWQPEERADFYKRATVK